MNNSIPTLRKRATLLVAVIWVGVIYVAMRFPILFGSDTSELVRRYQFTAFPLMEPVGVDFKQVRGVHPSFKRISAWISAVGAGVALVDIDGDGLPNDVCLVDPRTDLVTMAPAPGTGDRYALFALKPVAAEYNSDSMAPMGCVGGDFNEDGITDLLVYYWGRPPLLFMQLAHTNQTNADHFKVVNLVSNAEPWFSNAATLADIDGDGHTDIIIGNYFKDNAHILDIHGQGTEELHDTKSKAFNGGKKHLLLWAATGSGQTPQFREVTAGFSDDIVHGWALAAAAADLDSDLLPELYFSHDFGPDRLLHNQSKPGQLSFTGLEGRRGFFTPKSFVVNHDSFKGMGADFADINGDGLLDITVSNITSEFALQESHLVWLNTGETDVMKQGIAPFVQSSEALGLSRSGWGWDMRMADFDNDGQLEVVQATGFLKGTINRWPELQALGTGNDRMMSDPNHWPRFVPGDDISGHEPNAFFARGAEGKFHNIAKELGVDSTAVSRGIATADVDGDGDLDFVVANQWEPSVFYRNDCPNCGKSLVLHLTIKGNQQQLVDHPGPPIHAQGYVAIGAEARVKLANGRQLIGQVDGGNGHSGKRSQDLHFGLGQIADSDPLTVELRWRDTSGQVHHQNIELKPGWHSLELG